MKAEPCESKLGLILTQCFDTNQIFSSEIKLRESLRLSKRHGVFSSSLFVTDIKPLLDGYINVQLTLVIVHQKKC